MILESLRRGRRLRPPACRGSSLGGYMAPRLALRLVSFGCVWRLRRPRITDSRWWMWRPVRSWVGADPSPARALPRRPDALPQTKSRNTLPASRRVIPGPDAVHDAVGLPHIRAKTQYRHNSRPSCIPYERAESSESGARAGSRYSGPRVINHSACRGRRLPWTGFRALPAP